MTARMMANRFQVEAFPTYILMDHEGIIQFRQQGWNPHVDAQIDGEIRSLLKKAESGAAAIDSGIST